MPTGAQARGMVEDGWVRCVLTASSVGTWDWDISADRTRVCPITARLFGFSAEDVARGPSLADYRRAIHPEDREAFDRTVSDVRHRGGLFVAEYRTIPSPGFTRWVLARGRFDPDSTGAITRARGIVIDVTDSRLDGFSDGRALFAAVDDVASPLERFADLGLAAWYGLQDLPAENEAKLRPIVEVLLLTLGQGLANTEGTSARASELSRILHS